MAPGQQPLDLSAGMTPKAASPPGNIDLSAGMTPTQPQGDSSFLGDVAEGFKTGVNQTGETAMRVLGAIPGVGTALRSTPGWTRSQQQTHEIANAPVDTAGKVTGDVLENALEFFAGDEGLKGLSTAAKNCRTEQGRTGAHQSAEAHTACRQCAACGSSRNGARSRAWRKPRTSLRAGRGRSSGRRSRRRRIRDRLAHPQRAQTHRRGHHG